MSEQYPIIITVRDRLSPLISLLDWLTQIGQRNIWLCDNDSTYPPLVEFLENTNFKVVRNKRNLGHRAPWLSGLTAELGNDAYFVVTDPDVVPTLACPTDALEFFRDALTSLAEFDKVGFSLKIDDLPSCNAVKDQVLQWESQFWVDRYSPRFFRAPIDTTFAMYRPGLKHENGKALRSAPPYEARHLPWYQDSANPTDEDRYYRSQIDRLITNWNDDRIPANVRAKLWLKHFTPSEQTIRESHA